MTIDTKYSIFFTSLKTLLANKVYSLFFYLIIRYHLYFRLVLIKTLGIYCTFTALSTSLTNEFSKDLKLSTFTQQLVENLILNFSYQKNEVALNQAHQNILNALIKVNIPLETIREVKETKEVNEANAFNKVQIEQQFNEPLEHKTENPTAHKAINIDSADEKNTDAIKVDEHNTLKQASARKNISVNTLVVDPNKLEIKGNIIVLEQGVNQIIPIAVNHLNRLVTSFSHPVVKTSSNIAIEIEGPVIYVLSEQPQTSSLFITDKDDPVHAMSLTLVSKKIPPRDIQLEINQPKKTFQDKALESLYDFTNSENRLLTSKEYQRTTEIKSIMKSIIDKKIPKGFSRINPIDKVKSPVCKQEGIAFDFSKGMVLGDSEKRLFIGVVTNIGKYTQQVKIESCEQQRVRAMSFYPKEILKTSEQTLAIVLLNK